jgi:hypothetical protein
MSLTGAEPHGNRPAGLGLGGVNDGVLMASPIFFPLAFCSPHFAKNIVFFGGHILPWQAHIKIRSRDLKPPSLLSKWS